MPRNASPANVRTHNLRLHVLGSGSKGNCSIVEGPEGLVMIDEGLSRKAALERMAQLGLDPNEVCALILTHEHSDHTNGLPVWFKKYPCPIYASEGTVEARSKICDLPHEVFAPGDTLSLAGMRVRTFSISHDVTNPVGLAFSTDTDQVGYVTDTGYLPAEAADVLRGSRILALESNHDVHMLKTGDYPAMLQERILSDRGHLSNDQAAQAAQELVTLRTEALVAMHISQENNRPSIAIRSLAASLGAALDDELGTSATLEREEAPRLRIVPAGQNRPISVS